MSGSLGVLGWDADPALLAIEPATGIIRDTQNTPAARAFDIENGRGNFVYAALSGLVTRYDAPNKLLATFAVTGSPDVTAVAAGVRLSNPIGVWYATAGGNLLWQSSEDPAGWTVAGAPVNLGVAAPPRISAISAGGDGLNNLWVGTSAASDPRAMGNGLLFFDTTLDALGQPAPTQPRNLTTLSTNPLDAGIAHIAAETSGPFNGDAWIMSGNQLVRVSRAIPNGGGPRALQPILLPPPTGVGICYYVSLAPGSTRQVALATDRGLATMQ
jgi:hypothetical protein